MKSASSPTVMTTSGWLEVSTSAARCSADNRVFHGLVGRRVTQQALAGVEQRSQEAPNHQFAHRPAPFEHLARGVSNHPGGAHGPPPPGEPLQGGRHAAVGPFGDYLHQTARFCGGGGTGLEQVHQGVHHLAARRGAQQGYGGVAHSRLGVGKSGHQRRHRLSPLQSEEAAQGFDAHPMVGVVEQGLQRQHRLRPAGAPESDGHVAHHEPAWVCHEGSEQAHVVPAHPGEEFHQEPPVHRRFIDRHALHQVAGQALPPGGHQPGAGPRSLGGGEVHHELVEHQWIGDFVEGLGHQVGELRRVGGGDHQAPHPGLGPGQVAGPHRRSQLAHPDPEQPVEARPTGLDSQQVAQHGDAGFGRPGVGELRAQPLHQRLVEGFHLSTLHRIALAGGTGIAREHLGGGGEVGRVVHGYNSIRLSRTA